MGSNFVFKTTKKKKINLKKIGMGAGIVFLILFILGVLIIPSHINKMGLCEKYKLGSGMSTLLFGGCQKNFREVIFVVGNTKNSPAPAIHHEDYINAAFNLGDIEIYAISVADPYKTPKFITDSEESTTIEAMGEDISNYLKDMKPKKNGANYFEAILTAAENVEKKDEALIYVIGSGLSDGGLLNFADQNLLANEISADDISDKIAEHLDSDRLLKDISIVWEGCGQTVFPQAELDTNAIKKVKSIYEKTFKALGSKSVNYLDAKNKDIETEEKSVETNYVVKPTPFHTEETIDFIGDYSGNESTIFQFNGGGSDFIDPGASNAEFDKVAGKALSTKQQIRITAFVSRGGECRDVPDENLINSRLSRIKEGLTSRGISQERIILQSGGFGEYQECENGRFVSEDMAKKNRRVIIEFLKR